MPFRLLLYTVRIWEQIVRETPTLRRLPAIVPLILHHSEHGMAVSHLAPRHPRHRPGGADDRGQAPPPVRHDPRDDLERAPSDDSLRARAVSALGRLALFGLRHAREPQVLLAQLGRWLDLVREVQAAPGGREALVRIWRYILVTSGQAAPEAVVARLLDVVGSEHSEGVMTAGEQLIERGKKEAEQRYLLKLLGRRFGALSDAITARIQSADSSQLSDWFDRAITAATLEDVLDPA